ncbi:hypothetical protein ONS95_001900 [Cadophora gregata]|uniref:uncharacterized protein n=1 Tax=Cadophora gregata TaxID=51156 RepID=UPI0026DC28C2|nr:uncharacterized protein ONS95_001900 [Cadophora gregata]KAK0111547.1 hypothetical protein ONS95_001900 [Cadophora gregata]KAK0111977.1 hypothetical protein ONS96_001239 [Cadophora gregata f. sp. sojae]
MPICTLHILSLTSPISKFLQTLSTTSLKPLTTSLIHRWIILPSSLSIAPLLAQNIHWDILLILPSPSDTRLPASLQDLIQHQWTIEVGIPSRILKGYEAKNSRLLNPRKEDLPALSKRLEDLRNGKGKGGELKESSQDLELSPELLAWIKNFTSSGTRESTGAVSMLNLLAFKPGMKESYLKYGKAFAESAGSSKGGDAKIVGSVIQGGDGGKEKGEGWDEVALAHYPSLWHFADMLASEEYQDVNRRYRVGSLRDTCILFTSEVGIQEMRGAAEGKAKL